ncbi:hypothetical protein MPTK1_1g06950 [Marchantia polymorpha subsp. ruderalis]|uniref:Uncharacterized protein n=2 Tax=Marchantia polymorpha TaxID=3197 RepID=A0AAF6AMD5_MARPO|nr:hypothetical protein MARPO_0043s0086 [Marchantia polymorpha]BBM97605.1 hypothetical protein Mp_1g06950 [Marchantia polymorpha subsp. ruderalis]|eukprot:PTQ39845.1 hypothetical protein MARPO_0043s0086 [Marchantia polymorpha]
MGFSHVEGDHTMSICRADLLLYRPRDLHLSVPVPKLATSALSIEHSVWLSPTLYLHSLHKRFQTDPASFVYPIPTNWKGRGKASEHAGQGGTFLTTKYCCDYGRIETRSSAAMIREWELSFRIFPRERRPYFLYL